MLRKDLKRDFPAATNSADPAEIERFNAQADEWWNPDGSFKLVHDFNRCRLAHLSVRIPNLLGRDANSALSLSGLRIVDVGCGGGLVAEPLSKLGADVLGIDAAERNIETARRHADSNGSNVSYLHALPEDLTNQSGTFDVALSLEVVEHVADLSAFLSAVANLVAPGGILIIGTLNRTLRSYAKAIVGAEYIMRWLPRGTHDWRRFVTPSELDGILNQYMLVFEENCGVEFDPFTTSWSIGRNLNTNYLQFYRKH